MIFRLLLSPLPLFSSFPSFILLTMVTVGVTTAILESKRKLKMQKLIFVSMVALFEKSAWAGNATAFYNLDVLHENRGE